MDGVELKGKVDDLAKEDATNTLPSLEGKILLLLFYRLWAKASRFFIAKKTRLIAKKTRLEYGLAYCKANWLVN